MKLTLILVTLVIAMQSQALGQNKSSKIQADLLNLEKGFAQAIVKNDAEAIGRFLADDWIIIDPDGGMIDRSRFLAVIKSGTLSHEIMESDDVAVRIYGDTAIVTGVTTSKGKFMGHDFTTRERATDILVKQKGQWHCAFSQLTRISKK